MGAEPAGAKRRGGAVGSRPPQVLTRTAEAEAYLRSLKAAFDVESEAWMAHPRAVEWFLDNEFLVHRVLRQLRRDMPEPFRRELPRAEDAGGRPRVQGVAEQILAETALHPSLHTIERAAAHLRRDAPLTTAELWALPAFLRIGVMEELLAALARLVPSVPAPFVVTRNVGPRTPVDEEDRIAACIRSFRVLSDIDWKEFFRRSSEVERVLMQDPARVYGRMDFDTQDRYRDAIERLARRTGRDENDIARRVVGAAHAAGDQDEKTAHVGYHLVGDGLADLERDLGCRPTLRERLRREFGRRAGATMVTSIAAATIVVLAAPAAYLAALDAGTLEWTVVLLLALVPASTLGVTLVHWLLTSRLPPRVLPKLDLSDGVPRDCRTAVVIPCLIGNEDEVQGLVRQLELHYLQNRDPELRFVLLTDYLDADEQSGTGDAKLLEHAATGIRLLNAKYGMNGEAPFHLLHRRRLWNASEGVWMGWERKRGKLEEFSRLLLEGPEGTSFVRHEGDAEELAGVRFVITLDAGTELPRGAAAGLIGTLAHPLNRAEVEEDGSVRRGYTVVQPRVEITPTCSEQSWFTRIFAGDAAIDIYSRAVSDVYQDLSGQGIYFGKGIYDVAAFHASLEDRVPENALVSHDHFEGLHGRAALATDIVLYEDYPPQYLVYARRLHRWTRGDWQLLPWLLPRVRTASGQRVRNRISLLGRWMLFDNLRRSLLTPVLVVFLLGGWLWFPGEPWVWTVAGVLAPAGHIFTGLVSSVVRGPRRTHMRPWAAGTIKMLRGSLGRWMLYIAFLAHESFVTMDAVVRTLVRLTITRRRFLEWRTADHTAKLLAKRGTHALAWSEMIGSPLLALGSGAAIVLLRPESFVPAVPFLALWLLAPEISRRISRPLVRRSEALGSEQTAELRRLARRTWFFFETFVGPQEQWLPPDNYQEDPLGEIAHRTSPTNIGMYLTSTLAAYDFGYLGAEDLAFRLRNTFETVGRLELHRGHLLNWYDTRSLEPLAPRYVSTVDSGNLAASLLTVGQGCAEVAGKGPILGTARWEALSDLLDLFEDAIASVSGPQEGEGAPVAGPLPELLAEIRDLARNATEHPESRGTVIDELCGPACERLDRELLAAVAERHRGGTESLRELRVWLDRTHQHLRSMRRELELLAPWRSLFARMDPVTAVAESDPRVAAARDALGSAAVLPPSIEMVESVRRGIASALGELVAALGESDAVASDRATARSWCEDLRAALEEGATNALRLQEELLDLGVRSERSMREMNFGFLYDFEAHLFHIGYNVPKAALDENHYDLLASEARIASFLAIAKGDVPLEHWFHLGRPLTRIEGRTMLISWGGSMFEYLMPSIWMRSGERTLISQSVRAAVDVQIRFGGRSGLPWGVSESGFHHFDPQNHYQYRSFGVPGLGLRRGLAVDRVVSPYASLMSVGERPRDVVANLARLRDLGMVGSYGLYEAADFTPDRVPPGRTFGLVRSYMAHHQGMILAALVNYLKDESLVRRFHASAMVQTAQLILNEQVPVGVSRDVHLDTSLPAVAPHVARTPLLEPWHPQIGSTEPELHLLSNGRLTSASTDGGAGWLQWSGIELTRWSPDSTLQRFGLHVYLRDEGTGEAWSIARDPCRADGDDEHVVFHAHMIEYQRRRDGMLARMDVTVAPRDDVEVRIVTLVDESGERRELTVTSCAEPVLAPHVEDRRHPAFSRLFLESEPLPDRRALLFRRRARSVSEQGAHLFHAVVGEESHVRYEGHATDRERFIGRGRDAAHPAALDPGALLDGAEGATLDAVMALRARVVLEPFGVVRLAFVTAAGPSREATLEIADRYRALESCEWAIHEAEREASLEAHKLHLEPGFHQDLQLLVSSLLLPRPGLRASHERRRENRQGQPGLWGHGISGDHPILLLRVREPKEATALSDVLRAHRTWRRRGLLADLVILLEGTASYSGEDEGAVSNLVERHRSAEWRNRRGGIFVVHADHLSREDRVLLEASARVVLDASRGSLREQLEQRARPLPPPPAFTPSRVDPSDPVPADVERPSDLAFDNGLGGFSPDGREYVVHLDPGVRTPAPWTNVLANPRFGCLVTESGLGYSWAGNSSQRRITTWYDDPVTDPPCEVVWLRDEETGAVWTPTPRPAGDGRACTVRHGAGTTDFLRNGEGLRQRMRVLVPREDPLKLVEIRLHNVGESTRRLTVAYYAELVLGEFREEARTFVDHEFHHESGALLARNPWNPVFAERTCFMAASEEVRDLTVDRAEFLGRGGDPRLPAALLRTGLSGRVESGVDPCSVLRIEIELDPAEERTVWFVLGEAEDRDAALELVRRYRERSAVDSAERELQTFWDDTLGTVQVRTPEPAMDVLLNRWLPYQVLSSRVEGRTGFYQSSGAFGFRDQLQDVMALVHGAPEIARAHLLAAAGKQFEEGDVLHWWHEPEGNGVRTRCSDDLLWLPYVTCHYVRATGDRGVLAERVPFLVGEPLDESEEERYAVYSSSQEDADLLEHCRRALQRGLQSGEHGLPLIGAGDWNDGMNRVGDRGLGESVWLGWFCLAVARDFAELLEREGRGGDARAWRERAEDLRSAIEASAWDGSWYLRAWYDDGAALGAAGASEAEIDLIAQAWSAISGGGDPERVSRALEAVEERLVLPAERLVLLLRPPFGVAPDARDPGYIAAYPPGVRENGGQYTHAASWLGWAHAARGDGAGAERVFRLLNPVLRTRNAEELARYRVEPYVIAADVYGVPPHVGRGGWTWYTGAASWTWRLGVEAILGLRRVDGDLVVDPCIPPAWDRYEATVRTARGTCEVRVENPEGTGRGVVEVRLDGQPLDSNRVPLRSLAGLHEVLVRLGTVERALPKDAVRGAADSASDDA